MTTIRRLAAILALDVVGYSRLMQADEAGTLAALKSRRTAVLEPLVARHRGRIVKLMGDGALIEFASAVDAALCAIELQRDMAAANQELPEDRQIRLRIGINLGDVIVEGSDIYGNGVNLAARLEALAQPGGICLSAKVHDEVGGKIKAEFDDLGEREMKNIAGPVRVYQVRGEGGAAPAREAPRSAPNRPSIAVLPFVNMSGDAEHEFFADGMTEDIITELSRFRNLLVIARNSSFVYKGKPVNVGTVARELGVEYVLEGSVRRAGNRVRITAQLVDAASGNHIWAERYDRELADIFAVQDEVTVNIVGTLAVELEDDTLERAQRKRPENLQAYEHWLRGKRHLWTAGEKNLEARRHFERAIAVDPKFSRAHSGLAVTYLMDALDYSTAADFRSTQARALACAERALALDDANYQAHVAIAWTYLYRHDYDRVKRHIERAIKLNPNDADTLGNAIYLLALLGEADEAVRYGEIALRLNPRHPDWYLAYYATALFVARRYPEALTARYQAPDVFIDSTFYGAALLAHMGRLEEARRWAEKAVARLAARPGAGASGERDYVKIMLDNNPFRRAEDREHFADGMRKAGVPG